ncbi:glycosyltransferase [Klebsiella sp. RHBSTW-00465]|uniref:glycosyltransferase n=1 Tax=Klebsiella sp. RHBSTW-00465 TaxID=2742650 RepID=UPI0015F4E1B3|nr:glycosyltransferase [Klebsiella sp. RHBSTW-00465]MBA7847946.1 glycosyltransferase [Klebsiella sp. RHBSTW-00465]
MKNEEELVSVYVPTSNRLNMLKRAVKSVLSQDYQNIELLICDDLSSDGTEDYVKQLCETDKRIRYFRSAEKSGACAARNLGIFAAKGKYITGLDDDDEFTSDRISCFLSAWDDRYSFLCSNYVNKYVDGKVKEYKQKSHKLTLKGLLIENLATNQVFTLTERLQSIGGFDKRALRFQDWDTWIRLCYKYGDFKNIPKTLYIMNHDHAIGEARVTRSYPAYKALNDLKERNIEKYSMSDLEIVEYLIKYHEGTSNLSDALKATILTREAKFFIKDVLKKVGFIKNI